MAPEVFNILQKHKIPKEDIFFQCVDHPISDELQQKFIRKIEQTRIKTTDPFTDLPSPTQDTPRQHDPT